MEQGKLTPGAPPSYGYQQASASPGYSGPGQLLQQPVVQWMPMPEARPGCPQGLEYLANLDQLLIHQQVELLEVLTNVETLNRYVIKNTLGQQCYFAQEESDLCMRNCCGPSRGFVMHITDNTNREVIRLDRQFKCCAGCSWCATGGHCSHIIDVESPPGNPIGKIVQGQSCCGPRYQIQDASGQEIFKIEGPSCICTGPCCTEDIPFEIFAGSVDGQPIGRICKQYAGYV